MTLALKRLALSAFLVFHVTAVGMWTLPCRPLNEALGGWTAYYLLPTGQWQDWGMFAPTPPADTLTLEAVARDASGLLHRHAFPRMMDRPSWRASWGYRHSKYAHNVGTPDARANREFAARYAVRAMGLSAADFPADVQLIYQVWPTPPPDSPDGEPEAPWQSVLETYHFATLAETLP